MRLVLKVDVDTFRGTREGVPRLVDLFGARGIAATFLFALGPDHTGRAIQRVFRPGFFAKVQRTSVVEHYGVRTLLYGTLLPGPDIGRRCAAILRAARDAGHECGIHTWDHVLWQDHVRHRDAAWTARQLELARARFMEIFDSAPLTHGAAGWQMNDHALLQLDAWGMAYASDTRVGGTNGGPHGGPVGGPFIPRVAGRALACVQLPTTLPTLDELIGVDGMDAEAAARHVLALTTPHPRQNGTPRDHVFTLHTELEGAKLLPAFTTLLNGWRDQGYRFDTLGGLYASLDRAALPVCPVVWGELPGRSGQLVVQGAAS